MVRPKVNIMFIMLGTSLPPDTISTMFSTTTMPGKKDMTNICSGVNACSLRQRRIMQAASRPAPTTAATSRNRQLR